MRASGIIRRVDDLGRICIPKEIRRTLRMQENEPLEIFFDEKEGSVTFKKYVTEESKNKVRVLVDQITKLSGEERNLLMAEIDWQS